MAQKRLVSLLTALLLMVSATFLPALAAEPPFLDMAGREISLKKTAERIIALMPGDCELLYAIGPDAAAKLIGRGEYCDYPETIQSLEVVKSGKELNLEQVIALNPDVVIITKMGQTEEQVNALEKAGIAVVVSDAQNLEGVYAAAQMLGRLTGCEKGAEDLVASMKAQFAAFTEKCKDAPEQTVYYEVSPLEYGLWAAGGGSFMDEIGQALKLKNIFATEPSWAQVSEEQVISLNPDIIVTNAMYFGEGPKPAEEICARAGWQDIHAVQNKKVLHVDTSAFTRPGPRLMEAIETLYQMVYEAK